MGICICEHHGRTGIILVCPHLADISNRFQKISTYVERFDKDADKEYNFGEIYYLCKNCDKEYDQLTFWEVPDELLESVCAKCFIELSSLEN